MLLRGRKDRGSPPRISWFAAKLDLPSCAEAASCAQWVFSLPALLNPSFAIDFVHAEFSANRFAATMLKKRGTLGGVGEWLKPAVLKS